MSDIGFIRFTMGEEGMTLTITGPEVDVGPASVAPTVGVRRDPQGRYRFVMGSGETVITPETLPGELRAALGGVSQGHASHAGRRTRMPRCEDIRHADGRMFTYQEYLERRAMRSLVLVREAWWPELSETEYNGTVAICRFIANWTPSMPGARQAEAVPAN